jgi:hypothetical protein
MKELKMTSTKLPVAFVVFLIPSVAIPSFLLGLAAGLASKSANPDGKVLLAYVLLAFMALGTIIICRGAWKLRKERLNRIRSKVTQSQSLD